VSLLKSILRISFWNSWDWVSGSRSAMPLQNQS